MLIWWEITAVLMHSKYAGDISGLNIVFNIVFVVLQPNLKNCANTLSAFSHPYLS